MTTILHVATFTKGGREVTRAFKNHKGVGQAAHYAVERLEDPEIPSVTVWRYRAECSVGECLMRVMDAASAPKEGWADTREIIAVYTRKTTRVRRI